MAMTREMEVGSTQQAYFIWRSLMKQSTTVVHTHIATRACLLILQRNWRILQVMQFHDVAPR
jgi:hypothetical protein